ncbi:unnamed protein product [Hermetia illucens]|uniref:Mariner Mos1 transposase n=1 Tax=Hermetia illucens TaxID=343691 RepID=A0A7R8YP54_HERIL|nr:unnamed protein product [Hermetia illucens]
MARVRPELYEDLLHDNAGAHTVTVAQQFLTKKGVTQLSHSPYSPDLGPTDYFAFPRLKFVMMGIHATIEDTQKSVTAKLEAFPASEFNKAMNKLQYCANERICVNGDYFE